MSKIVILPAVGRIEGLVVNTGASSSPADRSVEIQYTAHTPTETWHSLTMPLPDALYLLNLLDEMCGSEGLQHLRRPPP